MCAMSSILVSKQCATIHSPKYRLSHQSWKNIFVRARMKAQARHQTLSLADHMYPDMLRLELALVAYQDTTALIRARDQ